MKRYADLYLETRRTLLPSEGERAPVLARELLALASGKSVERIIACRELYAPEEVEQRLSSLVRRTLAGEPLAYLTGRWVFHGLPLTVTPDVLIPRDDTEAVAELAIRVARSLASGTPRVLDLCTGSGCIGLAVASEVREARVTLGDISPAALRVAKQNTQELHLSGRVSAVQMDVRKPAAPFLGQFDLIVSNPPYVTTREMELLDASVRDYEPHLALHGGADGMDFYSDILTNFHRALKPGGWIALEFGAGQHESVCALLEAHRFAVEELKEDLGGIVRAVLARDTREENGTDGIEKDSL